MADRTGPDAAKATTGRTDDKGRKLIDLSRLRRARAAERRRLFPSRAIPARMKAAVGADPDYGTPGSPDWTAIDWRPHVHAVEVDGVPVTYADIGPRDGRAVVFVHGLGGVWQTWLENLPAISQQYRAIALDLPGFGSTPMPKDPISIPYYGRFVDAFCEQLGLGAVAVVGNSMGGFIGCEMAIQIPARVERLTLANGAGISTAQTRRNPWVTFARAMAARANQVQDQQDLFPRRIRARHYAFATVFRHPTLIRPEMLYECARGTNKPGFVPALEALLDYDFRDRLPEIEAPTLIVHGGADFLVPVADADEFERLIPHSRKIVYPDTGHCVMIERARTFNADLLAFLAERDPAAETPPAEHAERVSARNAG